MEEIEEEDLRTSVEAAREVILTSPLAIEEEFQKTANPWVACFGSRVFAVEIYLQGSEAKEELGSEAHDLTMEKIERLKKRLHELREQYVDEGQPPPDEVKQELLEMLNVI